MGGGTAEKPRSESERRGTWRGGIGAGGTLQDGGLSRIQARPMVATQVTGHSMLVHPHPVPQPVYEASLPLA